MAQLVERCTWDQRVAGSSLTTSCVLEQDTLFAAKYPFKTRKPILT